MKYKLKYVDGHYSRKKTIATEIGSILHKGLELKGISKMKGLHVDYEYLKNVVENGSTEESDKDKEYIPGTSNIMMRYFEEWFKEDERTEMCYNDKMKIYFKDVLPMRMEDPEWKVVGTEVPFEMVYDERCIVHGFIDRIDKNVTDGHLKVIDYKSSKKIFRNVDIKTPLQMVVYDLACIYLYGVLPEEHEYDFILLDKKQETKDGVCSKGYLKRGITKINSLLDKIDYMTITGEYPPAQTPLCYWCSFADMFHTPNCDEKYAGECQYYSLWKPEEKTFKVNKKYEGSEFV